MGPGISLFLSVGTGLGIGLFGGHGWGWQAIFGAALIALLSILLKSERYLDYIANCEEAEIKASSLWYFGLSFLQNAVVIFIIALIVFFVKGLLE